MSNRFKEEMLQVLCGLKNVEGDFAELGIFKAGTFKKLLPIAYKMSKVLHGFDSFKGMDEPTENDYNSDGITEYPKGKFNTFGCDWLIKDLEQAGYKRGKDYFLWEGYIPEVFYNIPVNDITLAFSYIDLDHYLPTKLAIEWTWQRLSLHGVMLLDDYFPERPDVYSTPAILQFLEVHGDKDGRVLSENPWINYSYIPGQIAIQKVFIS